MLVLNPATVQEFLDFGLFGFALSRFSGCWIGFKATSETVESSASVHVDPQRIAVAIPADFEPPPGGLHIRWPRAAMDWAVEQERRLHGPKLAAVRAFARANRHRPHGAGFAAPPARHHGNRQGLSRSSPGAERARHPRSQWRRRSASASARSDYPGRSSPRARWPSPTACNVLVVEEARLHRAPTCPSALQRRCGAPPKRRRQDRRDRRAAVAEHGRVDAGHWRAPWSRACSAWAKDRGSRSGWRAGMLRAGGRGAADAVQRAQCFCSGCPHTPRRACPKAAAPWPASAATAWRCSCRTGRPRRLQLIWRRRR